MLVRGIVLGGLSASGLSLLFLGTVAMIAPVSEPGGPSRSETPLAPQAAAPGAAPTSRPEALPEAAPQDREVAAARPAGVPASAPATGIDLPAGSQFGRANPQATAAPAQPDSGPARAGTSAVPTAPSAVPEAFAPTTESAAQPDIVVALAPVQAPQGLLTDPAAPVQVVEGAPATFAPTEIGEEVPDAGVVADVAATPQVIEDENGTIEPTEVTNAETPPPVRPVAAPNAEQVAEAETTDPADALSDVPPEVTEAVTAPDQPLVVTAEADIAVPEPAAATQFAAVTALRITGPAPDSDLSASRAPSVPRIVVKPVVALSDTAPVIVEAAPTAPIAIASALADAPPAQTADAAIGLAPIDTLGETVIPETATIADASPGEPVTSETAAPAALLAPTIEVAEAPGGLADALTLGRNSPEAIIPAQARRIIAVPDSERVVAPSREETGPQPAPIVPRILTPGQPRRIILDSEAATETLQPETDGAATELADSRAISRNAGRFEGADGRPLFGIVLVDDGSGEVSADNLAAFEFPVTFALDATLPDVSERARIYRDAGHEVVVLADAIPVDGTPQDIEIALAGTLQAVPEATAVLDTPDRRLARNRATLPALADSGHGLVTHPVGLGSAVNDARRAGVPAAQLFRILDEDDERATVITRYLDRATFEAAKDGSAIVVGRARADTVTALYSWRLGERSEDVQIAPLSALLLAEAGN